MRNFKTFISEDTVPYANVRSGTMDVRDSAVRDNINGLLAGVTSCKFVTPYIAFERVTKVLAGHHIFLPGHTFLEGDSGSAVFPVNQYGVKIGVTDDGNVITSPPSEHSIYFEYRMSDCGMFEIFCEVVDQEELDEILSDVEAELNGEGEEAVNESKLAGPEKGPHKVPGSEESMKTAPGDKKMVNTKKFIRKKLDEVVTARRMKPKEKKAHAEYIVKHKEKLAANDTGIKAKKNFGDYNSQIGHIGHEPSKMKMIPANSARYFTTKMSEESMEEKKEKKKAKFKAYRDERDESKKKREDMKWQKHRLAKEEVLNELSKGTLASYIKKASHDVATKSAATGRYADRANKVKDQMKSGDYSNYQQGKKDDATADKMFKKSWKRREGIAKAADKLTKEGVDLSKIRLNKDTGNISSSDPKADLSKVKMDKKTGNISATNEEAINELSAKLVGKVNKARLEKPSKTKAASMTLTRAVTKKWLESDVGKLKQ